MLITTKRWFDDYENITALAEWLVSTQAYSATTLLQFLKKPWCYDQQWEQFQSKDKDLEVQ